MNDGYQTRRARSQVGTRDVQPLGAILRTLLRRSWLIVLVGVAVFLLALGISSPPANDAEATTRIGLTNEVVWPFYDAARDRLEIHLTEPGFDTEIEQAIDAELIDLTMVIPANQAFVEVTAVADDGETAAAAATIAAERLVERSVSAEEARLTSLISDLDDESADLGAEADELARQMEANLEEQEALVGDATPEGVAGATRLQSTYRQLELQRDGVYQEQLAVQAESADLGRELRSVQPEAEVLRRAEITEASSTARPWATALLAGLAAAMVTGLLVIILEREFGRIRTPWHASSLAGADVMGHITVTDRGTEGVAVVADHVLDELARRNRVVGVTGTSEPSGAPTIELLAGQLPAWGLTVLSVQGPTATVDPTSTGIDAIRIEDLRSIDELEGVAEFIDAEVKQDLVLVDLDGEYDADDRFRLRSRICGGIILVAVEGVSRAPALRATAGRVRRGGETLIGVLLVQPAALASVTPAGVPA